MRKFVVGSSVLALGIALGGCANDRGQKPESRTLTRSADASTVDLRSGGADVLRLQAPDNTKAESHDGFLKLTTPKFELDVWAVPQAHTVDEAAATAGEQITSEFKDFKADRTMDITVAGSPAKHLVGTGHEADDGDDGQADMIVFKVGDHVFIALTHDEKLTPAAREGMAATVETAQAP